MKIKKCDVMLVDVQAEENPLWTPILIRIYTDSDIYGDGEAGMTFAVGATGAYGCIIDFASKIIGMDPLEHELIWETLYKSTFWGQNGGPVTFSAISAIDIALWDIRAKYFNVPLYKLLGGKLNSKLRTYASQLQFGWGDRKVSSHSPEDYARHAKEAVAEGFDAIKIDFFTFKEEENVRYSYAECRGPLTRKNYNIIEKRLSAVREAVGADVDIIMENHAYTDAQGAIQLGKLAEKYEIMYMEEPTTPSPMVNKLISDKVNVPLAQGERIYSRWQYAPYFYDGSIALIQPDIGNTGGITETKKICDMAHVFDVGVQVHVCASPLMTAAALHLEAAIPNFTIHEHHVYNRHQYNKKLCIYDYQPEKGLFEIPERVGLGNEFSEYCFKHSKLTTVE